MVQHGHGDSDGHGVLPTTSMVGEGLHWTFGPDAVPALPLPIMTTGGGGHLPSQQYRIGSTRTEYCSFSVVFGCHAMGKAHLVTTRFERTAVMPYTSPWQSLNTWFGRYHHHLISGLTLSGF